MSRARPMRIAVILGTAREGNATRHVAAYVTDRLRARGARASLHDAASLPFGNLARPFEELGEEAQAFAREMRLADGFVLVFPEYNHAPPGALKNVLDHLYEEWARKPFGLVSTGGAWGGVRAQENLLPVLRELRGVAVPTDVAVPRPDRAFGPHGPLADADAWARRVDAMLDDLAWWSEALARAREAEAAAVA